MTVTYTILLTVTRPVRSWDHDVTIQDAADWMVSADAHRELERETLRALRVMDGDCDLEVLETSLDRTSEEDSQQSDGLQGLADRGCDTWAEHRCER